MQMRRFWGIYESGRRVIRDRFAALAALALLLFALTIGPGPIVQAQQEVSSYGLVQVLSGVVEHSGPYWDTMISIVSVEADAKGGEIRLQVRYSDTCNELYRFHWAFEKDITQLRPGESFTVTGTGRVEKGSCEGDHNPFMNVTGLDGDLPSPLIRDIDTLGGYHTMGGTGRIYARAEENFSNSGSAELQVVSSPGSEHIAFQLHIIAGTPYSLDKSTVYGPPAAQTIVYDVAYLYRANWQGEPETIPPGEGSGEGGGTGSGEGEGGGSGEGGGTGSGTGASTVPGNDFPPPPPGSREPAVVNRMALQAGQRRVAAGDLVYVPVWLINGANVANINLSIGYDAGVAAPEGDLIKGNLLANALFSSNSGERGLIRAGFAQTSGVNGTGTVAYMPFRAIGQPGDRTVLDVGVSTINDPGGTVLTIDRIDGAILIVGPDGLLPGDCDGDDVLTELDALCALQISVKLIPERRTLDVDGDGQVTSRDAVVILQGAVGK